MARNRNPAKRRPPVGKPISSADDPAGSSGSRLRRLILIAVLCLLTLCAVHVGRWLTRDNLDWIDAAGLPASTFPDDSPKTPDETVAGSADSPSERKRVRALLKEADGAAEELARQYPGEAAPLLVWAQLRIRFGDAGGAIALWKKCLEANPECAEAYLGVGQAFLEQGRYALAEKALRRARRLDPAAPQIPVLLANALFNQGKLRETIDLLEPALQANPGDMPSWVMRGQACLQLQQAAAARHCFQQAVDLVPDYPNAHYGLAMACERLGKKEEAAQHLARFRELDAAALQQRRARDPQSEDAAAVRAKIANTYLAAAEIYAVHGDARAADSLRRQAALDAAAGASP